MADVLNNEAIDLIAQYILGKAPATPSLKLRLFVNNVSITDTTVEADLTECTATGYAAIALAAGTWTGATSAGVASYAYPQQTFNITAGLGQTIYGHYVTDETNNTVLWGQTWTTPFTLPAGASTVKVTPSWTDEQCP